MGGLGAILAPGSGTLGPSWLQHGRGGVPYLYSLLIYTLSCALGFPARPPFLISLVWCDPYRIWGPSLWFGPLSRVLGPLGCKMVGPGAILAPGWGPLGHILAPDGGSWGHLGCKMGGLGAILAPGSGTLGPSWLQHGGSWGHLGHLGSKMGALGPA